MTATVPDAFGADIDRDARRALVEGHAGVDGIDFVEVLSNHAGTPGYVQDAPRQRTLLVHLLNAALPPGLDRHRVLVTGGVRADPRVNPVGVEWAHPAVAVAGADGVPPPSRPAGVSPADVRLVDAALPAARAVRERVLVVRTTTSGDASEYTLRLLGSGGSGVPAGFDPPLSQAPFRFTVDCPSDLDCSPDVATPPVPSTSPVLDYLARDADPLTTRLLDRLSTLLPGWTDRSPADPAVMLVELFANLGDRLAYWQDAVAVEAYLGTARQRTSVRRHARLLDYAVHEGCSARAWIALSVPAGPVTLPAGAALADLDPTTGPLPLDAHDAGAVVFETCAGVRIIPARNGIELHAWGDPDHVLPAGATSAYLAPVLSAGDPGLHGGDVLILADVPAPRPAGTEPGDPAYVGTGDPAARFAVRLDREPILRHDVFATDRGVLEIHWDPGDALPAPLRVTEPGPDGRPANRAVALANVVLADHGASVNWEPIDPPQAVPGIPFRPRLARTGLAHAQPVTAGGTQPAGALGVPDPRAAVPQLTLDDTQRRWQPTPDLIGRGRLDPAVVAEPEPGGVTRLRFGDGVTGRAPTEELPFSATYRLGGGPAGNVGAGRLTRWLARADGRPATDTGTPIAAWNPLPGAGGADPEPLEQVRQLAPAAFRKQLRAVTSADYAATAQAVPGVQRSVARRRWTGSWYAQEVTIDAVAARAADPAVPVAVETLLETRRTAGVDVEVAPPIYVPLLVRLFCCVATGSVPADVERQLLDAFSARVLPGGVLGFFHPDRFSFGQPLYVSDLVASAMAVPGLARVEVRGFARLGAPAGATAAALAAGRIDVAAREVIRCDSDPNDPEAGHVELELGGAP